MLRRILVLLSLAALLTATAMPSFAWKFASIADSRGSDNGVNKEVLAKIVNHINSEGVDLVVFQGDAVSGTKDDAALASQMTSWLFIMNKLDCPWYYTPGNHEVQTSTAQENVLRNKVRQSIGGPAGDQGFTFSFDHQNAHFVLLNSDHFGSQHKVQTDWMASDLAKTTKTHIFVMAHDPAYPAGPHKGSSLDAFPAERDAFWKAMEKRGVGMYLCGHEHLYQRTKHGSIVQVINGSCGAPLYKDPGSISKYHYVIADVNGDSVKCEAKDENGEVFDSWSYKVRPAQQSGAQFSISIGLCGM